ncbi:hypothetical protein RclHR1_07480014 [Rhizophagus clarus]|uniref:Uncharacterized protein n=1 Tax=Rhizophagus clarus TaxID=94130 RepID=A0A2Z6RXB8_9GLOM|nr:hypothetical protein RclHR1_07480014 [Rhizophagus clarus]GES79159.1 hypothetical protein GLOIN_2v1504402 [Rhizophagus clarus]
MSDSIGSVGSDRFIDSKLFKVLGGYEGLCAITIAMIFVAFIIIIFIVRIIQYPHLRQQVIGGSSTQSIHTRILKAVVFFLFIAGLVALTIYNIYKMIHDPPKLLPATFEPNTLSPSMLFCPSTETELQFISAYYYDNFDGFDALELFRNNNNVYTLNNGFKIIKGNNGQCHFFDGTLSMKPKDATGGYYNIQFQSNSSSNIVIFIGDTDDKMDWTLLIPEGNVYNEVGIEILNDGGILQYTESRRQVLDGSYTYRSFQTSIIKDTFDIYKVDEQIISIGVIAPKRVIKEVEVPSFKLADLFSSIGGYLSMWVVVGFLFGGSKANPFGFVTRFIFIKQDRAKLLKELEKMNADRNAKINTLEKEVDSATETNNLNDKDILKNLLAKYYVNMEFYEHAVKSLDV